MDTLIYLALIFVLAFLLGASYALSPPTGGWQPRPRKGPPPNPPCGGGGGKEP